MDLRFDSLLFYRSIDCNNEICECSSLFSLCEHGRTYVRIHV